MIAQLGSTVRMWQVNVIVNYCYIGYPFICFLFYVCYTVNYWKAYQQVVALFNKYTPDPKASNCDWIIGCECSKIQICQNSGL